MQPIVKVNMAQSEEPSKKVERLPSSQRFNCIAAIDFGTSYVSLAYTTPLNKGDVHLLKLNKKHERVPNAILLHKTEGTGQCIVEEFGYTAQSNYSALEKDELDEYIYFQEIKTAIQTKKYVDQPVTVTSLNGETYYLIEVIAFIIKHIKNVMLHQLRDQHLKASDFDWVITVPAIWKAKARRMMREAAYLAGLTCDNGGITKFTDTSRGTLPRPLEVNPHKLTLALEPEAAAIYAHNLEQEVCITSPPSFPDRYMVVDIGGGTVDITVHDRSDGKIDVIIPPTGNTWGGITLNQTLRDMIEDLLDDKRHQHFFDPSPIAKPTLNTLYHDKFKEQKKIFGDQPKSDGSEEVRITFPPTFVEFYSENYIERRSREKGLKFKNNDIFIRYDKLKRTIFRQKINNIIVCVKLALSEVKEKKIHTIYLVGGFGGSSYVKHSLQEALAEEKVFDHIICPQQADLAVTIGAVMWRQAPDIIQPSRADATYGIDMALKFNPSIHDKHYRSKGKDGTEYCRDVFQVFIRKGDTISQGVCYKTSLKYSILQPIKLPIYATTEDNVQYTVDKEGKPTVTKIGELMIDTKHVPSKEILVHILIEFICNEILVTRTLSSTGEVVKMVCDTLTYHEDMDMIYHHSESPYYIHSTPLTNLENEKRKQQILKSHESLKIQKKEKSYSYLQRSYIQLEWSFIQLEECHTQLRELHTQLEQSHTQLQERHTQLEQSHTQLQERHTQLEQSHTQLQEERTQLEQNHTQLQERHTQLEQSHTQLQEERTQLEQSHTQLQERHTQLEQSHTQLQEERTQLEQSHTQLQERHTQLEQSHTQLQEECTQLEQNHIQLQEERTQLEQSHTQLQERHTQLEQSHTQLEQSQTQLQEERTQLDESHTQLQERLEVLQRQLQLKENELGIIHEQLKAKGDIETLKISHKELIITNNELGRGGWGVIRKGQLKLAKVAVKQIHDIIVGQHSLGLLNREIITMAQLRHPNLLLFIGAVFDHPSGNPMIITEVMDTSLRKAYEEKELTPDQQPVILSIMRDVAVGLNYLHSLPDPIIHRDVSSANVLLNRMGPGKWQTKISDFGSAKIAKLAVTMAPGAEIYTAPEIPRSIVDVGEGKQTPKADVFSYGILLCEILICTLPGTDSPLDTMLSVVLTKPQGPLLHQLIKSCIEREPTHRPTMEQIITTLHTLI